VPQSHSQFDLMGGGREKMKPRLSLVAAAMFGAVAGATAVYLSMGHPVGGAYAQALPTHPAPPDQEGGVVVQLCDGVTTTKVEGLRAGQQMSRAQALAVTGRLMAEWQRKHPDQHWVLAQAETGTTSAATGSSGAGGTQNIAGRSTGGAAQLKSQQGDTYASFHDRDYMIWKAQTDAFVDYGNQVFHSAKLLGGTIGVSCDMCHPNASNTHPETYPKYQVQLQRVALLRDMINWCIENPVKGKTLSANDPKLHALEAYILGDRRPSPAIEAGHRVLSLAR
jgi:thiosulfate dehydrogenase